MAFQKVPLSASTHGRGISVTSSGSSAGTTIHTASATTTADLGDEIVLFCANTDTAAHLLTLNMGSTSTSDVQQFSIAANTTTQVMTGLILRNSLAVTASSTDGANKLNIFGYALVSS